MKSESNLRLWHSWWSVILALPIAIVSLTAIFIAHEDSLGLKRVAFLENLNVAGPREEQVLPDIRAVLQHDDGTQFLGTKNGLLVRSGREISSVADLRGVEIRALVSTPSGLVAAAKNGIWVNALDGWRRTLDAEAWSVAALGDGSLVAAIKERGLMASLDGGSTWLPYGAANEPLATYVAGASKQRITLHKLVMDMHTGRAFFGKDYEWLWIDAVATTMLFLTFSGLIIWGRNRRRRLHVAIQTNAHPTASPVH